MPVSGSPYYSSQQEVIDTIIADLQKLDGSVEPDVNLCIDEDNQIFHGYSYISGDVFPWVAVFEDNAEAEDLMGDLVRWIFRVKVVFWQSHTPDPNDPEGSDHTAVAAKRNALGREIRRVLKGNRKRFDDTNTRRAYDSVILDNTSGDNSMGENIAGGVFSMEIIHFDTV